MLEFRKHAPSTLALNDVCYFDKSICRAILYEVVCSRRRVFVGHFFAYLQILWIAAKYSSGTNADLQFFQQALEQKEPGNCVKLPPSANVESPSRRKDPESLHGTGDGSEQRTQTFNISLKEAFKWRRDKRKGCHQEEDTLFSDELVFVARIPLVPKTTAFWCRAIKACSEKLQKRQRSKHDDVENQVYAQVVADHGPFVLRDVRFAVNPEFDSCFLYVVPGSANRIHLWYIRVSLEIELDANNSDLSIGCTSSLKGLRRQNQLSVVCSPLRCFVRVHRHSWDSRKNNSSLR